MAQLKRLSEHCEFGATTKEMLRDRILWSVAWQTETYSVSCYLRQTSRCTAHGQSHGGSAAAEQNAQVHQPPSQPAEGQDVNLTNGDEQEAASNVATRATVAGAQNTSATCT